MNIDSESNTYIASIAKVRDDGNKDENENEGEAMELKEGENVETL